MSWENLVRENPLLIAFAQCANTDFQNNVWMTWLQRVTKISANFTALGAAQFSGKNSIWFMSACHFLTRFQSKLCQVNKPTKLCIIRHQSVSQSLFSQSHRWKALFSHVISIYQHCRQQIFKLGWRLSIFDCFCIFSLPGFSRQAYVMPLLLLVHGQVTIIFVVSVCLFVCLFVQSFSQPSLIRFRSN